MRAPVSGIIKLAIWLITDGGQPKLILEIAAVRRHRKLRSAVAKTLRFVMHVEIQIQRIARLERFVKSIYSMVKFFIREVESRRTVKRYFAGFRFR